MTTPCCRQPTMLPNRNINPIIHHPLSSLQNSLSSLQNATPSKRTRLGFFSIKYVTGLKIFSPKHLIYQGISIMKQTPNLFPQHSIIKHPKIPKTPASKLIWKNKESPTEPNEFSQCSQNNPTKIFRSQLQYLKQTNRKKKNAHRISRDRLNYRLDHDFLTSLRK